MSTRLISREVRLDADGMPWTSQPDPILRERIRNAYRQLYGSGEQGRQLVAVHQELVEAISRLTRLVNVKRARHRDRPST